MYLSPQSRRPEWLTVLRVLNACEIPDDSLKSRRAYAAYMNLRHEALALKKMNAEELADWAHMERGWVHGSKEFRERMLDCIAVGNPDALKHVDDAEQKKDLGEAAAEVVLLKCVSHFGIQREELPRIAKSAPDKLLIAGLLRYNFPVSAAWVAGVLVMGHYTTVSRAMKFYDKAEGEWAKKKAAILKFSG